jgi:hypothetical protein
MAASRDRSSYEIGTPGLALMIKRGWVDDTPEIQAAWKRFDADRNPADFQRLVEHYSPKVLHEAWRMKRRSPRLYRDGLEDMVADGLIGMMRYIRQIPSRCRDANPHFLHAQTNPPRHRPQADEAIERGGRAIAG